MACCIKSCFCMPFVSMYRCCCPTKVKKVKDQKVTQAASPTFDPADPYRRKETEKGGHIKHRSWQIVNGKMRYEIDDDEPEKKMKRLKSYRSPRVVRDD